MLEKEIEKKLRDAVRKAGGVALKFVSPGTDGMPDRLLLFPGGHMSFVETKAPGKKLRPLQEKRKNELVRLGFQAFCVDSAEQIPELIRQTIGGDVP